MYCSNCGTNLPDGTGQCPVCGAVMAAADPMPNTPPPPPPQPTAVGTYFQPPKMKSNGMMTYNFVTHILSIVGFFVTGFIFFLLGVFVSFIGLFKNDLLVTGSSFVGGALVLAAAAIATIILLASGGKTLLVKDPARYIKRELIMSVIGAAVSLGLLILGLWAMDFDLSSLTEFGLYFGGWTVGLIMNVIAAVFAKKMY